MKRIGDTIKVKIPERYKESPVSTKTAITHQKSSAIEQVPAYLKREAGTAALGMENMERADMTLPRLSLCQSMSPQRKRSDAKYIDGLAEGEFFNTITLANYGNGVKVVPLHFFKTRLLFKDMDEGGGVLCRSDDNQFGVGTPGGACQTCPLAAFGKDGDTPSCTQLYNYAVLVVENDGSVHPESLAVLSLKSTGIKFGRDWNALMRLRNTDIFAGVYELTGIEQKKDAYSWYVPTIKPAGWVSEDSYNAAKMCYQSVREFAQAGKLRMDETDLRADSTD